MTFPASQTPDPAPQSSSGADAFVLLAIALVAIAIGAGLHVQAGVSAGLAIGAAAGAYAGFGLLHLLLGRSKTGPGITAAAASSPEAQHTIYMPDVKPAPAETNSAAPALSSAQPVPAATPRAEPVRPTPAGQAPAAAPSGRVPPVSPAFKVPPPAVPRHEPAQPAAAAPPAPPAAAPVPPAAAAAPLPPAAASTPNPASLVSKAPEAALAVTASPAVPAAAALAAEDDPLRDQWSFRPASPYFEFSGDYGSGAPPLQVTQADRIDAGAAAGLVKPVPAVPPAPPAASEMPDIAEVEEILRRNLKMIGEEVAAEQRHRSGREADLPADAGMSGVISTSVDALKATAETMRQAELPPPVPAAGAAAVPPPLPSAEAAPVAQPGRTGAVPAQRLAMIAEAISADRADVMLEPILGLADHRARHYEVSIRLRAANGGPIEIADYESLNGTGLLPLFDRVRTLRAANIARRLSERGKATAVFSGLSGETLSDVAAVNDTAGALGRDAAGPAQLVLTFSQADVRAFAAVEWSALNYMRGVGFGFAISDVVDLDMDFARLVNAGFAFAKLDAEVYLDGLPLSDGIVPSRDVCRHLSGLGLSLIVDHIDDEAKVAQIAASGVALGQGALFGSPRHVKAEALERNAAA